MEVEIKIGDHVTINKDVCSYEEIFERCQGVVKFINTNDSGGTFLYHVQFSHRVFENKMKEYVGENTSSYFEDSIVFYASELNLRRKKSDVDTIKTIADKLIKINEE